MRNSRKHSVAKIVHTFSNFATFRPSVFLDQNFFLTVGQNNFGKKYHMRRFSTKVPNLAKTIWGFIKTRFVKLSDELKTADNMFSRIFQTIFTTNNVIFFIKCSNLRIKVFYMKKIFLIFHLNLVKKFVDLYLENS